LFVLHLKFVLVEYSKNAGMPNSGSHLLIFGFIWSS